MQPIGYSDLFLYSGGPLGKPSSVKPPSMAAGFKLNYDIANLLPYINAVAHKAELLNNPALVRFGMDEHLCVLYPDNGVAVPFQDRTQAVRFVDRLMEFINDIHRRKAEIVRSLKCVQICTRLSSCFTEAGFAQSYL